MNCITYYIYNMNGDQELELIISPYEDAEDLEEQIDKWCEEHSLKQGEDTDWYLSTSYDGDTERLLEDLEIKDLITVSNLNNGDMDIALYLERNGYGDYETVVQHMNNGDYTVWKNKTEFLEQEYDSRGVDEDIRRLIDDDKAFDEFSEHLSLTEMDDGRFVEVQW